MHLLMLKWAYSHANADEQHWWFQCISHHHHYLHTAQLNHTNNTVIWLLYPNIHKLKSLVFQNSLASRHLKFYKQLALSSFKYFLLHIETTGLHMLQVWGFWGGLIQISPFIGGVSTFYKSSKEGPQILSNANYQNWNSSNNPWRVGVAQISLANTEKPQPPPPVMFSGQSLSIISQSRLLDL